MAKRTIKKIGSKKTASEEKPKKRKWGETILIMLGLGMMLTACVTFFVYLTNPTPIAPLIVNILTGDGGGAADMRNKPDFNVLLAGLDKGDYVNRSDTIMIAHVSIKKQYVSILSIPRDTRLDIPGHGPNKVNHAWAIGGFDKLKETLEKSLNIPIHYHFVANLEGVKKLIDAVDGIEVNVEKNMKYTDRAQDLHIDLQKGRQVLDGEKTLEYCRFRHDFEGDYGRMRRQQEAMKAFGKKMLSLGNLKNVPKIVEALRKEELIETDVSLSQAIYFGKIYNNTFQENLHMETLRGESAMIGGISYELPDLDEMRYTVGATLAGGYDPKHKDIRVEVRNGCQKSKIAEIFARRLAYFGYNVVGTGNADSFDYEKTQALVKKRGVDASLLKQVLGAEIVESYEENPAADIIVVLGWDLVKTKKASP